MVTKKYMNAPSPAWWVVLKVVNHFLKSIVIAFDTHQLVNDHISQQMHNLNTLLNELVLKGGVTRDESITEPEYSARITNVNMIMMGPFIETENHLKEILSVVVVLATE